VKVAKRQHLYGAVLRGCERDMAPMSCQVHHPVQQVDVLVDGAAPSKVHAVAETGSTGWLRQPSEPLPATFPSRLTQNSHPDCRRAFAIADEFSAKFADRFDAGVRKRHGSSPCLGGVG
jgi:hypothetical protein